MKFDDFEFSVYRSLSCLMSNPVRCKLDVLLLKIHWSHILHPHFPGLDCHKYGFYSGFPLHTLPNRCPISPIETTCRPLHGKNIKLRNSWNICIIYHVNITYAILSCIKLPLSEQTRMAFFPFLPFWEHFLFPPLKHGLLSLKFFGFVNWIPNSVHADLHSSMPVIFDPPVHCLCKK